MGYEEKGTWVFLVVGAVTYAGYLVVVLGRLADTPATEVAFVRPLLWSLGISMAAAIVGRIAVEIVRPSDSHTEDVRDRDIDRRGTVAGNGGLVAGALVAFVLALADQDRFWIANALYLGFVLAALIGAGVKLVAYRRGF